MSNSKATEILEDLALLEMANLDKDFHGLGNYKLHLLQPGNKQIPHGKRVKVFTRKDDFTIKLDGKASVVGKSFISGNALADLKQYIVTYEKAFLAFWKDSTMTQNELGKLIDAIDNGTFDKKLKEIQS